MSSIRDTVLGQLIRLATTNRVFQYEEEKPGFQVPWHAAAGVEEHEKLDKDTGEASSPDSDAPPPTLDNADLSKIETSKTRAGSMGVATTRTKTREQTRQWTQDRFDVERQEAIERSQSAVITPQKTADGITLVDWYTTDDPENPQNWSSWKKAYVVFIIFIYTFAVYAGSAIYTSSEPQVMAKFGVGYSKASLGLSMYVIGYGVGPLIFSPLSEVPAIGRNYPYVVSLFFFVILSIPTALSNSYATLLVLRFLTGFFGSPCLATGGATMGDIYGLLKLPYALSAWTAAAFCAPALGPLLSGFAVTASWRWSLWEILIMSGPVFAIMFATLPETSASNILLRRAERLRKATGRTDLKSQSEIDQAGMTVSKIAYDAMVIPILILIQNPGVGFINLYTSFVYGVYYSFFEAFPLVYVGIYGFNIGELGIVFICIVVGCVIGIIIYSSYVYFYLEPDIKKNGLRAQEHRLVPALFAVTLLPAGLFWFGWTSEPQIHWIVSIIGITLYAVGAFIVFQCIFMYLPLTYPRYAASLFAGNDACRSLLAAGCIIFARPLYTNLGIGRGISVLGGLMCGGVLGMWALYIFGGRLRGRSNFAAS